MSIERILRSRHCTLMAWLCLAFSLLSYAAIASSTEEATPVPDSPLENGGYFELGVGFGVARVASEREDPDENGDLELNVGPLLAGAYRRGPFFIEAEFGNVNGLSIGTTLWHDQSRVIDRWPPIFQAPSNS